MLQFKPEISKVFSLRAARAAGSVVLQKVQSGDFHFLNCPEWKVLALQCRSVIEVHKAHLTKEE